MSEALEKIGNAIVDALKTEPAWDVVSVLAGHFTGLTSELIDRRGGDPSKQITIEGGPRRITIHEVTQSESAASFDAQAKGGAS